MVSKNEEVRVGVVGYGMSGQVFHAPIISCVPGLTLAKVVERHGQKSKERYPQVEVVDSPEKLFEDNTIDLVVITTPNASHFELAEKALKAGKHVVVEKPFTVTSTEAQSLIDIAYQEKRLLSVYQNRRWDGDFQTVRQIVREGLLGQIVEFESHYDRYINYLRPSTWKEEDAEGSGIAYDLGSHLIDQAQVLFGVPRRISADVRKVREGSRIDDSLQMFMEYENLTVTLKASMLVREIGPRFIVHGTDGSFVKYGLDPQEAALKGGISPLGVADWGCEGKDLWGKLNTQVGGLHFTGQVETIPGDYCAYYRNIYGAITGREALIVKPEEARNTIRMIEVAKQSAREKKAVAFSL
ncbi:Oxidoreductase family, NAD-binding Rossmann fold [Acididesulfobacillus acetoxydans]|uniref:Oxidoreductase domain protein n=1 Tax=Acididesulfobacillus acetoxydans TaxID=1561005 RepID=A0A8S0Y4U3_9FIRM|nr:oxidoreductase [Acididesulfobacillus acetoxydans]CAA7603245.1 Oxidoreductase family, NAD-binding Rossmann fold [Acididesulfobacillus acetoxydans]CEJ06040.1 Oxidoreductase domain protein [Acididesulfobacillus acetoxydans]